MDNRCPDGHTISASIKSHTRNAKETARDHAQNFPASTPYGMPSTAGYPMPDPSHAANAKARATQQYEKGNLSKSEMMRIDALANRVIRGK